MKNTLNVTNISNAALLKLNDEVAIELIPAMLYVGILMIVGIFGNLLVCFIFSFRLRMGTQHFLIIWLAVFDLLTCFIAMPTEIVDMRYFFVFNNEFACRLLRFITHYCAFASILTLVVIAIDRYMKVCRPFKPQMSLRHVKMALVLILLVALIFAGPSAGLYGTRTFPVGELKVEGHDCSTNDAVKATYFPLVYNSVLFVTFSFLSVTLSLLYTRIWREMRRHNRYMARNSDAINVPQKNASSASEYSSASDTGPVLYACSGSGGESPIPDTLVSSVSDVGLATYVCSESGEIAPVSIISESEYAMKSAAASTFGTLLSESDCVFLEGLNDEKGKFTVTICNGVHGDTGLSDIILSVETKAIESCLQRCSQECNVAGVKAVESCCSIECETTSVKATKSCVNCICKGGNTINANTYSCYFEKDKDGGAKDISTGHENIAWCDTRTCSNVDTFLKSCRPSEFDSDKKLFGLKTTSTCKQKLALSLKRNSNTRGNVQYNERDFSKSKESISVTKGVDCSRSKNDCTGNVNLHTGCLNCQCEVVHVKHSCLNCQCEAVHDKHSCLNCQCESAHGKHSCLNCQCKSVHDKHSCLNCQCESAHGKHSCLNCQCESAHDKHSCPNCQCEGDAKGSYSPLHREAVLGNSPRPTRLNSSALEVLADQANSSVLEVLADQANSSVLEVLTDQANSSALEVLTDQANSNALEVLTDQANSCLATEFSNLRLNSSVKGYNSNDVAVGSTRRLREKSSVSRIRNRKATVIAFSVTVVFFVSFVPHLSLITARIIQEDFDRVLRGAALVAYNIFLRSYFVNSASNPIIYGVLNPRFRAECVRLLRNIFFCDMQN